MSEAQTIELLIAKVRELEIIIFKLQKENATIREERNTAIDILNKRRKFECQEKYLGA